MASTRYRELRTVFKQNTKMLKSTTAMFASSNRSLPNFPNSSNLQKTGPVQYITLFTVPAGKNTMLCVCTAVGVCVWPLCVPTVTNASVCAIDNVVQGNCLK